jgi:hypothetical protein
MRPACCRADPTPSRESVAKASIIGISINIPHVGALIYDRRTKLLWPQPVSLGRFFLVISTTIEPLELGPGLVKDQALALVGAMKQRALIGGEQ